MTGIVMFGLANLLMSLNLIGYPTFSLLFGVGIAVFIAGLFY